MAEPQGSLDGAASAWKCTDANCGMELPGSMTGMRFCPRCNLKKQIQLEKGISLDSKTKLNEREEPTPITQSIPKDSVQGEGSPALTPGVADTAMKSTEDGINFPTQETGTPGDVKDQVGATLVTGNDKKDCDADKSAVVAKTQNNCNRSGDDTPKLNLLQVFGDTEVTQESGANNSVESQKDQKDKQSVLKIEPEKQCDQQTEAKQESGASNTVKTQKNQEDKVSKKEQEKKRDQQKKEEKKRKTKEQEEQRKERAEKRNIENQQREEEKTKRLKENQEKRQRELKERQEIKEQQEDRKRNAHTVDTAHDPLQMKVDGQNDKKNGVTERKKNDGGQGDGGRKTEKVYKYTLHRLLN